MGKPKRYGSRGTITRDNPDDTIVNPNEKQQRARNQAMWGTETMLHEFWEQNVARGERMTGSSFGGTVPQHPRVDFSSDNATLIQPQQRGKKGHNPYGKKR